MSRAVEIGQSVITVRHLYIEIGLLQAQLSHERRKFNELFDYAIKLESDLQKATAAPERVSDSIGNAGADAEKA